jgi:GTP-binding protein
VSREVIDKVPVVLEADFVAEAREVRGLPAVGAPEIAIAGRSNVGKSTLLNRLAARKALARTSKTPGRTRGVVFFDLVLARLPEPSPTVERIRLADLPGYGYAKVSRTERQSWQPLIEGYTRARPTLALFVILVDARRGLEDEERQLYQWLGTEHVPAQVVFTKIDKLSTHERGELRARCRAWFGAPGPGRASPLMVSGETGEGTGALWAAILQAAAAQEQAPVADQPPRE